MRKALVKKRIFEDEFMAAAFGDTEWLRQSVINADGVVKYDEKGYTSLHIAASFGRLNCIKLLVEEFGYSVDLPTKTGIQPLMFAISNKTGNNSIECVQYLISNGANPSLACNNGNTPAHQVASEGHIQILKLLIEKGAKLDQPNQLGKTPLDIAKIWGHKKCARIIAFKLWHERKEHVAQEMNHLKALRLLQSLKAHEDEHAFLLTREIENQNLFKKWLKEKGYNLKHLGPDPYSMFMKPSCQEHKLDLFESVHEPRSKIQESDIKVKPGTARSFRQSGKVSSSRKFHHVVLKTVIDSMQQDRLKTQSALPGRWNNSIKVFPKSYTRNLSSCYPLDEYTMMCKDDIKYFDGQHQPSSHLSKKTIDKVKKSKTHTFDLPPDVIAKGLAQDPTRFERPIVFKSKHVDDILIKRMPLLDERHRAEVSLHLCDDPNSFLFRSALSLSEISPSISETQNSEMELEESPKGKVSKKGKESVCQVFFPHLYDTEYSLNFGEAEEK